jgi:hypothetical protein
MGKWLVMFSMFLSFAPSAFAVCCNPGGQPVPAFNTALKCKLPLVWISGNSCNPPAGCCKSISGNNDPYCAQRIVGVPTTEQYKMCIADMQNCKWSCTTQSVTY